MGRDQGRDAVDDEPGVRPAPPSLKAAVRRARIEDAERSEVLAELRGAEMARLEMLQSAIAPLIRETPEDADIFDVGLTVGDHPRLFVDMIAFIEMGRDKRLYRFVQNTRHGSVVLAESKSLEKMTHAVADYVARRLIEREKALASDELFGGKTKTVETRDPEKPGRSLREIALGLLDLLESTLLVLIVAAVVWFVWRLGLGWSTGRL
jgi:hypothetical protein